MVNEVKDEVQPSQNNAENLEGKSDKEKLENPDNSAKKEGANDDAPDAPPLNILVIDDSKALRRVLIKYLQNKFNCTLFEADNGKDAFHIITEKKGNIDLILCDLMMPVMDGLTFMKTIKENVNLQKIPVVFLTAKNDKETVTKCIKLGASDFIVKPYDLASVTKKLSKFLVMKTFH